MENLQDAFRSGFDTVQEWLVGLVRILPHLIAALVVVLLFFWIGKILRRRLRKPLERAFRQSDSAKTMVVLLSHTIFIVVILMGVLIAASILGLDKVFTSVLASAGVLGLAIGYAFKDVAANLFAGIVISLKQPIKIDDLVKIDDYFGTVINIDLLYATVQTLDGQTVYVPNQVIYSQAIVNYSTSGMRRIVLNTGVSYGDDLEEVRQLAQSTIEGFAFLMLDKPIDLYFTDIGGSSYNFVLRYWIRFENQTEYLHAVSEGIMHLKTAFEGKGISIPYPVQTLDFGVKGGVNLFDAPLAVQAKG